MILRGQEVIAGCEPWGDNGTTTKKWVKAIMIFTLAINQGILLKTKLCNGKTGSNSL